MVAKETKTAVDRPLTDRELFIWKQIVMQRDIHWVKNANLITQKTDGAAHELPPPKPPVPKDSKGNPIHPSNQKRYWRERRKKSRNRKPEAPTWP